MFYNPTLGALTVTWDDLTGVWGALRASKGVQDLIVSLIFPMIPVKSDNHYHLSGITGVAN